MSDFTKQATEQSLQEFKAAGVKKYKVDTTGDARVCSACKAHDGKEYAVKAAVPGKNAPPFCDKCRCVILPVF
jgi:SPP1 gp7 family putative phage head morphogenesis protein